MEQITTQKLGIEETHKVIRYRIITASVANSKKQNLINMGFKVKKHNGGGWFGFKDFSSQEKAKEFLKIVLNNLHTGSEFQKTDKINEIENLGFLSIKFLFAKMYTTHSIN